MLRKATRPLAWSPLTWLLCPYSSPLAQQLSFLRSGLLSNLYLQAPAPTCPIPLLQWLFQVRISVLPLGGGRVLACSLAGLARKGEGLRGTGVECVVC